MRISRSALIGLAGTAAAVVAVASTWGAEHRHGMAAKSEPAAPVPIRITMDDLHAHGGVPPGWTFMVPPGNAPEGRKVFVAMECFACHDVRDGEFPPPTKTRRSPGPELTGMGAHHPAAYFAESIMNPNRVIVRGQGFTGPDGLSTMPSYADVMTLRQLVDVVAYLQSLKAAGMSKMGDHSVAPASAGSSGHMR
jgi:mono/diheme cytochrome c family protein